MFYICPCIFFPFPVQNPFWNHVLFLGHISLVSFNLEQFLSLSLSFMTIFCLSHHLLLNRMFLTPHFGFA